MFAFIRVTIGVLSIDLINYPCLAVWISENSRAECAVRVSLNPHSAPYGPLAQRSWRTVHPTGR